jgi:hypothetical protein
MGTGGFSLGVKWPEHETDHSLPPSIKVMTTWSFSSMTQIHLHHVLLQHTSNFTFYHCLSHIMNNEDKFVAASKRIITIEAFQTVRVNSTLF